MNIREATTADLSQLCYLWFELIEYHTVYNKVFEVDTTQLTEVKKILLKKLDDDSTKIFVAELEDNLAGLIICSYTKGSPVFSLSNKGYIAETVVSKNYRGKGIGLALYKHAESWFKTQGADHIALQVSPKNNASVIFWREAGFKLATYHMIKEI